MTQLVSRIVLSGGRTISYEYDEEERITKVVDSVDGVTEYTYDALGQLLTEKHKAVSEDAFVTVNEMTYDNYGNIVSKNGKTYTYDSTWKDLLISCDGQSITYDAQGNPTSYLGHTLTWEKGRQLKSFDNAQYTYNANGIRTSKTVNGVEHTFVLDGTKILKESWGSNTIIPMYDNEDAVCGIQYNGDPYYFFKNLRGDVIAIVNKDAETVAKYSYDAWGVCTISQDSSDCGIATVNPFRYRGYYYDSEIGLYYLQSRYYNPAVGRFVNEDKTEFIVDATNTKETNLYAYCQNNPINCMDYNGKWLIQLICGVAGAAIFGTVANILCRLLGVNSTVKKYVTAGFALLGGILGAAFGPSVVGKIAPKALDWVKKFEKAINSKSNFRPILFEGQTIIGFEYKNFKIMLHPKHKKEPQKGWHISIQHKTLHGNWRQTIPDIPLKTLGKKFTNWAKKWLK